MTTLTDEDLSRAMQARREAQAQYRELIKQAREQGWNNSQIARAVGLSEGAIRLHWKRMKDQEEPQEVLAS